MALGINGRECNLPVSYFGLSFELYIGQIQISNSLAVFNHHSVLDQLTDSDLFPHFYSENSWFAKHRAPKITSH